MQRVETDLLVVGAGPAGLSTAIEAVRAGRKVLVYDGGDRDPAESPLAECDVISRSPYFDLRACRPWGLGGSTSLWGGWLRPFDADDFGESADDGWPLSLAEYQSYIARAHDLIGSHQPTDPRAWRYADAADSLSEGRIRTACIPVLGPRNLGRQWSNSEGLDGMLRLNATLREIVMSPGGDAVDGMRFTGPDGETLVRATDYVLACGGIENSRLLLSASGAARDSGWLARGFMEHPHVDLMNLDCHPADVDSEFFQERFDVGSPTGQGEVGMLSGRAGDSDHPRYVAYLEPVGLNWDSKLPLLHGGRPYRHYGDEPGGCVVVVSLEQRPIAEHGLSVTRPGDGDRLPGIRLDWNLTPEDLRTLGAVAEELRRLFFSLGIPSTTFAESTWIRRVIGGPHHMGTTRMSDHVRDGVVDRNQRVHGLGNLYLNGSSVFPRSGVAPPTLSVVALGIRLGEHLGRSVGSR